MKTLRPFFTLILLVLLSSQSYGQKQVIKESIEDSVLIDDTEIPFLFYGNDRASKATIIWFEPHFGDFSEQAVAYQLASQGFSVYQPNWFETFLLPRAYSSMAGMDGNLIAQFIHWVKQKSNQPVYLVGANRGAVVALNGIAADSSNVAGLVLLNPSIYLHKPKPMHPVRFVPAAKRCPLPIVILQPGQSTRIWWMEEVENTLREGGASVTSALIPGVRDDFWQRGDITPQEVGRKSLFHLDIISAINTLEHLNDN